MMHHYATKSTHMHNHILWCYKWLKSKKALLLPTVGSRHYNTFKENNILRIYYKVKN